jgi:hypothetical protein
MITHGSRRTIRHALQLFVESEDELRKGEALTGVGGRVHRGSRQHKVLKKGALSDWVDHMIVATTTTTHPTQLPIEE